MLKKGQHQSGTYKKSKIAGNGKDARQKEVVVGPMMIVVPADVSSFAIKLTNYA